MARVALSSGLGAIAFSLFDGRWWRLATVDPAGGEPSTLAGLPAGNVFHPTWAPDGQHVAFDLERRRRSDLYVIDTGSGAWQRLTTDGISGSPSWSPDGARIAFVRAPPLGDSDIYSMNADGSDIVRLARGDGLNFDPAWSPSTPEIAFVSDRYEGNPDIFVMYSDGSHQRRLTTSPGFDGQPAWSPRGHRIAFASDGGIYLMHGDGTHVRQLVPDIAYDPSWSPDGHRIVLRDERGALRGICVVSVRTGVERRIVEAPFRSVCCPDWAPSPPSETGAAHTVRVGAYPNAVAVGVGGAWVSVQRWRSPSARIVRLDPSTGEQVAKIPIGSAPTWTFGGAGMAVGAGSLWVTGAGDRGAVLTRIDPSTNRIVDVVALGGRAGGDVTVDETGVWVVIFRGGFDAIAVVRVDPATDRIVGRIPVHGEWSNQVFAADGRVWTTTHVPTAQGFPGHAFLYGIDPETNAIVARFRFTFEAFVPSGPNAIWARVGRAVQRFDPDTGRLVGPRIRVHPSCCYQEVIADGSGGVWVLALRRHGDGQIAHVTADGSIEVVQKVHDPSLGGIAYQVDPATRSLWVVHYERSVTRVSLPSALAAA